MSGAVKVWLEPRRVGFKVKFGRKFGLESNRVGGPARVQSQRCMFLLSSGELVDNLSLRRHRW